MIKKLWEMYENMNEIMYVSDIESYDVIYMNKKARDVIGIDTLDDIKGKKCYEVFQNSPRPCGICNNDRLKEGYFDEWKYFNPIREKTYMIKDTLVKDEGRLYRMELAFDLSKVGRGGQSVNNATVINEALKLSLSSTSPDRSIDILIEYVCMALDCKRIYIFEERDGERFENTYRWYSQDATVAIDKLADVSKEDLQPWLDTFSEGESIVVNDVEALKGSYSFMYNALKKYEVSSVIASPLYYNGKLIGILGIDNLQEENIEDAVTMFMIMGHFIVALLRRRDLFSRLQKMSFYDELTGLGNRYSLDDYISGLDINKSIGIVNCDVMGLKKINDRFGHKAGDELLIKCADCLKSVFGEYGTFRTGGDEFIALCEGISDTELYSRVEKLDALAEVWVCRMAIGCTWNKDGNENIHKLFAEADERMYEDKRQRYKTGLYNSLMYSG